MEAQFFMVKICIKACPFPFIMSFAKVISLGNCFLYGSSSGLQIDLSKTKADICIIANILTCFVESVAKARPLARNYKSKGLYITT
jgi:hypothetical protein